MRCDQVIRRSSLLLLLASQLFFAWSVIACGGSIPSVSEPGTATPTPRPIVPPAQVERWIEALRELGDRQTCLAPGLCRLPSPPQSIVVIGENLGVQRGTTLSIHAANEWRDFELPSGSPLSPLSVQGDHVFFCSPQKIFRVNAQGISEIASLPFWATSCEEVLFSGEVLFARVNNSGLIYLDGQEWKSFFPDARNVFDGIGRGDQTWVLYTDLEQTHSFLIELPRTLPFEAPSSIDLGQSARRGLGFQQLRFLGLDPQQSPVLAALGSGSDLAIVEGNDVRRLSLPNATTESMTQILSSVPPLFMRMSYSEASGSSSEVYRMLPDHSFQIVPREGISPFLQLGVFELGVLGDRTLAVRGEDSSLVTFRDLDLQGRPQILDELRLNRRSATESFRFARTCTAEERQENALRCNVFISPSGVRLRVQAWTADAATEPNSPPASGSRSESHTLELLSESGDVLVSHRTPADFGLQALDLLGSERIYVVGAQGRFGYADREGFHAVESFVSNRIVDIFVLADGTVFFFSEDQKISRFESRRTVALEGIRPIGLASSDSALWVLTDDHRLMRITRNRQEEIALPGPSDEPDMLFRDGFGRVLVVANHRTFILDGEQWRAVALPASERTALEMDVVHLMPTAESREQWIVRSENNPYGSNRSYLATHVVVEDAGQVAVQRRRRARRPITLEVFSMLQRTAFGGMGGSYGDDAWANPQAFAEASARCTPTDSNEESSRRFYDMREHNPVEFWTEIYCARFSQAGIVSDESMSRVLLLGTTNDDGRPHIEVYENGRRAAPHFLAASPHALSREWLQAIQFPGARLAREAMLHRGMMQQMGTQESTPLSTATRLRDGELEGFFVQVRIERGTTLVIEIIDPQNTRAITIHRETLPLLDCVALGQYMEMMRRQGIEVPVCRAVPLRLLQMGTVATSVDGRRLAFRFYLASPTPPPLSQNRWIHGVIDIPSSVLQVPAGR